MIPESAKRLIEVEAETFASADGAVDKNDLVEAILWRCRKNFYIAGAEFAYHLGRADAFEELAGDFKPHFGSTTNDVGDDIRHEIALANWRFIRKKAKEEREGCHDKAMEERDEY